MKVHESEDRAISSGSSISPSMTPIQTPSDCDYAKSLATASSLSISPLHQKNDHLSDQGHLNTPASVPHDMHVGDRGSTNTQTLLDRTQGEPSSYPLFDLIETLSFAPHQSFGHIEHLSTSADESQPKTPVSDHFKSMPVMHQPQVLPDTEHPRTQLQKSLQAVGISHPSFTKIGRFAHQPPDLMDFTLVCSVLCLKVSICMACVLHVTHQELDRAGCHLLRPVCNKLCFGRILFSIVLLGISL